LHPRVTKILATSDVTYKVHRHADYPQPITNPQDFADALGYPLERITKTVFLRSQDAALQLLAVCPIGRKLDLKGLALTMGCKRLEMAGRAELDATLGYPPNGVSPIGAGDLPVVLDAGLLEGEGAFPTILIGAGEAGVEIEIAPTALQQLTKATVQKIT
jgi:Cys-tRNA(Pro)/Cys-tRNA(Cys) deacylase